MLDTKFRAGLLNDYRLPTDIIPTHYGLTFRTDLEDLTFTGAAKISLDVKSTTSSIVLHADPDLTLTKATLSCNKFKDAVDLVAERDSGLQRVTYELPAYLNAGSKAVLKITFSGKLTGNRTGYYASAWTKDGVTRHCSLTQFEATSARRAFPCWDEPLLKATFDITLISRADTVNLSNMPAVKEEALQPGISNTAVEELGSLLGTIKEDEWKVTKFGTTPRMSTYLAAFANGHFEYLEDSATMPLSGRVVPVRVYSTPDLVHQGKFALDLKKTVLPLYEEAFDVEYPLPKLDTLVVYEFDPAAMENWGLIIGSPSSLLLDPVRGDLASKAYIAAIQCHEVAHMWFGNITTMAWWNCAYLNEGFATLMSEVLMLDKVFPEWKATSQFISNHINKAMGRDAFLTSHPVEVDVSDANDINQIFDAMSYSKAASVLYMLSNYVGEDNFLEGVYLYLKTHLFGSSVTRDLWEAIGKATGLGVPDFMESWITKAGFPVVSVTEGDGGEEIVVRQDRFLLNGPVAPNDNTTLWHIPLNILSTANGQTVIDNTTVLKEREKVIELDASQPFKLNAKATGYYRVLYTPERLRLIATEAAKENSVFSLNDRIGLVYDAMALSRAGLLPISSTLSLIDLWKNETEYSVWQGSANALQDMVSIWWEDIEMINKLNEFRGRLFVPIVDKLGFDHSPSDSRDTSLLRTLAITQAAEARDDKVVKELQKRFKQYMDGGDGSSIPPDLLLITFTVAARHGGGTEYNFAVKVLESPRSSSEKVAAITAAGSTDDPVLINRTLQYITDKAQPSDVLFFFAPLSSNPAACRMLTKYFQDNYDMFYEHFKGTFTIPWLVDMSCRFYSSNEDCEAVKAFFQDKDISQYKIVLLQALDNIRTRAACVERSTDEMKEWLSRSASMQPRGLLGQVSDFIFRWTGRA